MLVLIHNIGSIDEQTDIMASRNYPLVIVALTLLVAAAVVSGKEYF